MHVHEYVCTYMSCTWFYDPAKLNQKKHPLSSSKTDFKLLLDQYGRFPKPVRCWPHRRSFCNPTAVWKVVVARNVCKRNVWATKRFRHWPKQSFWKKAAHISPPITAAVLCPRCQEHGISQHSVLLHWGCNWLGAYIAVGPSRSAVTCCDHGWPCHPLTHWIVSLAQVPGVFLRPMMSQARYVTVSLSRHQ